MNIFFHWRGRFHWLRRDCWLVPAKKVLVVEPPRTQNIQDPVNNVNIWTLLRHWRSWSQRLAHTKKEFEATESSTGKPGLLDGLKAQLGPLFQHIQGDQPFFSPVWGVQVSICPSIKSGKHQIPKCSNVEFHTFLHAMVKGLESATYKICWEFKIWNIHQTCNKTPKETQIGWRCFLHVYRKEQETSSSSQHVWHPDIPTSSLHIRLSWPQCVGENLAASSCLHQCYKNRKSPTNMGNPENNSFPLCWAPPETMVWWMCFLHLFVTM